MLHCKQNSDPVILEDIVNQVEEKPNIRILYSEHQVFFRSNDKFSSFNQLDTFDCVDIFNNSWVLFNRIQRPLSPWLEIVSIIFIILFIVYFRVKYFDPQLLIKLRDYSKASKKRGEEEVVENAETTISLDSSINQKPSSRQSQNNDASSKRSLKKIMPIKLLLYYATLILVKLILSISFKIFQKPQFLFLNDILLVGSSCVLMSVWFEMVFRKRTNKKSDTFYFLWILFFSMAMAFAFAFICKSFDEIGEFKIH
jgi:hypothetical protein